MNYLSVHGPFQNKGAQLLQEPSLVSLFIDKEYLPTSLTLLPLQSSNETITFMATWNPLSMANIVDYYHVKVSSYPTDMNWSTITTNYSTTVSFYYNTIYNVTISICPDMKSSVNFIFGIFLIFSVAMMRIQNSVCNIVIWIF